MDVDGIKEIVHRRLTDIGILILLLTSSGRRVRNSNNVGTVAGFVPNFSIRVFTGSSQLGTCRAKPMTAKESWTIMFFGPDEYVSKAVKRVSRRASLFVSLTWARS